MSLLPIVRSVVCVRDDIADLVVPDVSVPVSGSAPAGFGPDVVSCELTFESLRGLRDSGEAWEPATIRFLLFPIGCREEYGEVTPVLVVHLRREERGFRCIRVSSGSCEKTTTDALRRPLMSMQDASLSRAASCDLPIGDDLTRDLAHEPRRVLFDLIETVLNPEIETPFLTDRDKPHLSFAYGDEALFRRLVEAAFVAQGADNGHALVSTAMDPDSESCIVETFTTVRDHRLLNKVFEVLRPSGFTIKQRSCSARRRSWQRSPRQLRIGLGRRRISALERAEAVALLVEHLGEDVSCLMS